MVAATLFFVGSANAAFIMYLDDSSTTGIDKIVQDDTLAGVLTASGLTTTENDFSADGIVTYIGGIGSFSLSVTTGVSKPLISGPGTMLDLNSLTVSGGSGTLNIGLTDTDFLPGGGVGWLNFALGGTTDGTVSAEAFMDTGNAEFGTGTSLGSYASTSLGAFSYNSEGVGVNTTDPYSLSIFASVTHDIGDISSFDAAVVPEPSILALMGLGLVGLGFASRRRQAK